eukprot:2634605-Pyramimonas_sp.AAC.1
MIGRVVSDASKADAEALEADAAAIDDAFVTTCLKEVLHKVGRTHGYARSHNLLRMYSLVPLSAISAEHDAATFKAEAAKGFKPDNDEHLLRLEVEYLKLAVGLQAELKAVYARTNRKTRPPSLSNRDTKQYELRGEHWAENTRGWAQLTPEEQRGAHDCNFTVGEAPIDHHAWGPFVSQDRGVLDDDFRSVIESVEALKSTVMFGTSVQGSRMKARLKRYSKLMGGRKTESGKYRPNKGRIFLKAHFSKKRAYRNVDSNSRVITLHLPQYLPGASASHKASQITSLMDFLGEELTSVATSDDRVLWSARMIWVLWDYIHRMVASCAGGELDEWSSAVDGTQLGFTASDEFNF